MNWKQLLSNKRFGLENLHEKRKEDRTEFQRDYDRLIFSAPFRRLQNKTQVFPLPGSIFVHNRLTHSLEVSCVGRSLGNEVAAELLKKEKELQEFARKTTELDLALAKLKKEHETALEAVKKTGMEQSAAAVAKATADLKANVDRLSAENLKLKVNSENLRTALSRSQELEKQVQKLNAENGELKRKAADFQKSLERFRKAFQLPDYSKTYTCSTVNMLYAALLLESTSRKQAYPAPAACAACP